MWGQFHKRYLSLKSPKLAWNCFSKFLSNPLGANELTHCGFVTPYGICDLSQHLKLSWYDQRKAITRTNANLLTTGTSETNFSEIWTKLGTLPFMKMHWKIVKCPPSCLGLWVHGAEHSALLCWSPWLISHRKFVLSLQFRLQYIFVDKTVHLSCHMHNFVVITLLQFGRKKNERVPLYQNWAGKIVSEISPVAFLFIIKPSLIARFMGPT